MDGQKDDPLRGVLHCPVCGREMKYVASDKATVCKCGETIPAGLALNSFAGCTHGLNCNCHRSMRR